MQTSALGETATVEHRKNFLVTADEFQGAERDAHLQSSETQQAVVNMVFKEADVTA